MPVVNPHVHTEQEILNSSFDEEFGVLVSEPVRRNAGATALEYFNPATEETLVATTNKLPTYDLYITYNTDNTVNTKVWKVAGTSTVVKTLTYNYSGGNLISKLLS